MADMMIARIPFTYLRQELERGELVELKGTPRDDQLRGLGYFIPFDKHEHGQLVCDMCGKIFASEGFRIAHKRKIGGCKAPSSPITRAETAGLLNIEPKNLVTDDY
jgi:hypothetical protein